MASVIHIGKVEEFCAAYDGEPFHALMCDPPYHLTSIVKRFGKEGAAEAKDRDGVYRRAARGFMGKDWDGGDVAFRPETWEALSDLLYPGAFIMAFAGTRGYHRMACAIEDAGLIIHPAIGWLFGCLSEDTEILTRDGWEPYHNATQGTDVMCYNNSEDTFSFQPVEELYVYRYSETAYRIHSARTDQLVSRNHRCLVERAGRLEFIPAEGLAPQEAVPILESVSDLLEAVRGDGQRRGVQEEDLRGVVREEGSRRSPAPEAESSRRGSFMPALRQGALRSCGVAAQGGRELLLPFVPGESERSTSDSVCSERAGEEASWQGNGGREESRVEGRRHVHAQARQLQADKVCPVPARVPSDGSQGRVRHGASTPCGAGAGPVSTAHGSGSPRQPRPAGQLPVKPAAVRQQSGPQVVRASRFTETTLADVTPVHYHGVVWCVRVPTGAFVCRRNGRIFVTGNSGFPKATRIKGDPAFEGHRYGLQALKPAFEFIAVAQKPYQGSPAENIRRNGAGALCIDGGRVGGSGGTAGAGPGPKGRVYGGTLNGEFGKPVPGLGRWPANLAMDEAGAEVVDRQSGFSRSRLNPEAPGRESVTINFGLKNHGACMHEDEGGASRYYHTSDWRAEVAEQIAHADPVAYRAKAGRDERDAGLHRMPLRDSGVWDGRASQAESRVIGNTMPTPIANAHPCVKPISLCRWLAALLLPPAQYAPRRILVPFAGSGSECIGAHLAGWDGIVGVEMSREYAEIAEARLRFWEGNSGLFEELTAQPVVDSGQQALGLL